MKFWKLALCTSVATLGVATAAMADDKPTIAFNAGITSDYMFRGIDQSAGGVAGFGGADVTWGKVYVGTWVSHVDFAGSYGGNDTLAEVDVYGGVRPQLGPVALDLGVIGYIYPKQPSGSHENYVELKALASVPVGPVTLGGAVYYSPDMTLASGSAVYVEGNAAYTFKNKMTLSGAVGYQDLDASKSSGLTGYTTWNVGVTYPVTDHLSADIRYVGTSGAAKNSPWFGGTDKSHPFNAADRVVGTLKVTF
jgi:uncharacterized protein (TIGR02001 family)